MAYAGVFSLDLGLAEGWERLIADEDAQTRAGGNRRYGDGPRSSGFCATDVNCKIISQILLIKADHLDFFCSPL